MNLLGVGGPPHSHHSSNFPGTGTTGRGGHKGEGCSCKLTLTLMVSSLL